MGLGKSNLEISIVLMFFSDTLIFATVAVGPTVTFLYSYLQLCVTILREKDAFILKKYFIWVKKF